ncbi:MAG: hypothetical protein KBC36_00335 [Spirochaetia bacterium]|nr:hypothetical protein [Spirochaetia bacterium]HOX18703.1 methyl-accepting chemotaxis protein [Spirochaetales bacterium]
MANPLSALMRVFTAPYDDSDVRTRKKARLLAPSTLVVGLLGVALGSLMFATGAFVVGAFLLLLCVFCGLALLLMAKGRYRLASSLFLYGLFGVMFAAIKFDEYRDVYECYVFGTLGSFLLVLTGLLAVKRRQAWTIAALDLAAIVALYLLDALPADGAVTELAIQSLATSALLVVTGGAFTAVSIGMQASLVDESERSALVARRQYDSMMVAAAEARESAIAVGTRLANAAAGLSDSARVLLEVASREVAAIDELDNTLGTAAEHESSAAEAQARVRTSLSTFSNRVLEATAAIGQMLHAIEEVNETSSKRKGGIDDLANLARGGEERIEELAAAIEGIVKAVERMDEINTLIGDVSGRTNLLGMNASIEAAHAGDAGKGFAVVAEEIRALSEEAGEGSRGISTLLADIQTAVENATGANDEARVFFGRMSEEIQNVSEALGGILVRLAEVSAGTTGIREAVDGFGALAESSGKATEDTGAALKDSAARSADSRMVAAGLRDGAAKVRTACETIMEGAASLEALGAENLKRMEDLNARLSARGDH